MRAPNAIEHLSIRPDRCCRHVIPPEVICLNGRVNRCCEKHVPRDLGIDVGDAREIFEQTDGWPSIRRMAAHLVANRPNAFMALAAAVSFLIARRLVRP
jgi:hypothetical protein